MERELPPPNALSARQLIRRWGLEVEDGRYHLEGTWWGVLNDFPGVLCDPWGYVRFETEEEYRDSKYLDIKEKTHLSYRADHLSEVPGYTRMEQGEWWVEDY